MSETSTPSAAYRRTAPVVIGVAGGSGSGKSTVIREMVRALGPDAVTVLQHDWYYFDQSHLDEDARARVNFDHPSVLDTGLLLEHLERLRTGQPVEAPRYDFASHTRLPRTRTLTPRPVLIVDGILVLADEALRQALDIRVFVDTDADLRLIRRIDRDIAERGRLLPSIIRQYLDSTRPMHLELVEPSKRYAHVILPEGGENEVGIDMLVTKVRALLAASVRPPPP